MATRPIRRFASLSRTVLNEQTHVLDAIDFQGYAWCMVIDDDTPPDCINWTLIKPLPIRVPSEQQP
jgi:hypothetical protein